MKLNNYLIILIFTESLKNGNYIIVDTAKFSAIEIEVVGTKFLILWQVTDVLNYKKILP